MMTKAVSQGLYKPLIIEMPDVDKNSSRIYSMTGTHT